MNEMFFGKEINLHYTEQVYIYTSNTTINHQVITTTLDELFKYISLRLTGNKKTSDFTDAISSFQGRYYIDDQDALVARNKFEQLGLLEGFTGKNDIEMIKLTDAGKEMMNKLNSD